MKGGTNFLGDLTHTVHSNRPNFEGLWVMSRPKRSELVSRDRREPVYIDSHGPMSWTTARQGMQPIRPGWRKNSNKYEIVVEVATDREVGVGGDGCLLKAIDQKNVLSGSLDQIFPNI